MKENLPYNMEKFAKIGIALTGKHLDSEKKSAYAGLDFIYGIHNKLNIPKNLKEYKIKKKSIPEIIKNSGKSNMQANPKPFTDEELENLLEKIL
jgi:alcohol dehydrogenase class IV